MGLCYSSERSAIWTNEEEMRKTLMAAFTNPQSKQSHIHFFCTKKAELILCLFPQRVGATVFEWQLWTLQLFGNYILLMYLLNNGNSHVFRRQNYDLQSLFTLKVISLSQFKQNEKHNESINKKQH